MAVSPQQRFQHRLRRQFEPVKVRAVGRPGVERTDLLDRHASAGTQVRSDLRHLLERPRLPSLRPGSRRRPVEQSASDRGRLRRLDHIVRLGGTPAPDAERTAHDRHRNLVVAATGTGKTVVAALDYQRLRHQGLGESLLFVAHRKEILDQAWRTYREVLAGGTFGELYVGKQRPQQWQHVFVSVQSLSTPAQLP
ncbi:MAG: DEAD/DEAH box helicase family protein [Pseudonocardiaceae bacterium]